MRRFTEFIHAALAKLAKRPAHNGEITGSTPVRGTACLLPLSAGPEARSALVGLLGERAVNLLAQHPTFLFNHIFQNDIAAYDAMELAAEIGAPVFFFRLQWLHQVAMFAYPTENRLGPSTQPTWRSLWVKADLTPDERRRLQFFINGLMTEFPLL